MKKINAKFLWVLLVGVIILAACSPTTSLPTEIPTALPNSIPTQLPASIQAALEQLAATLNIQLPDIVVNSVTHTDWPDACLGLPNQGESCAQVVTPGWKIDVTINGTQYEVRTNEDGTQVRYAQVQ